MSASPRSIAREDKPALTKKLEKLIAPPGFTGNAPGGPSRWSTKRSAEWQPLKPKLVVEVCYDHFSGDRFRHGTRLMRWRPDKSPKQCTMDQVKQKKARSDEAAEMITVPAACRSRQHFAGEIERAGDQDARRAASRSSRATAASAASSVSRLSAGMPTPRATSTSVSAGTLLSCRGTGTAMTRRASPAKFRRKPALSLVASMPTISTSGRGTRSSRSAERRRDRAAAVGVVAAVEPELAVRRRQRLERALREALHPRRPVGLGDARLEGRDRQRRARGAQRRDGGAGIVELMAADELRQRQIEQAVVVLIDQAAVLADARSSARPATRSGARTRLASSLDHREHRVGLRRDRRRHAALEDAGLLGGDLLERVAEKLQHGRSRPA